MQLSNLSFQSASPHWLPGSIVAPQNSAAYFTCMYIGNDPEYLDHFKALLTPCFTATSCAGAKAVMNTQAFRSQVPDLIIVDLALEESELLSLRAFMKGLRYCREVLVLYNSKRIGHVDIGRFTDFIDDVLDVERWPFNMQDKLQFLKKVKQHMPFVAEATAARQTYHLPTPKRILDIIISFTAIALLLPVFLLIALAIVLESPGPVLYNAQRAGRGFRLFRFYKFRTMVLNADKKVEVLHHLNQYEVAQSGARFFKMSNDPRVTRVGRFLRNTSLDELPQLFNVLKGDMSVVGNRPLPIYEAETLTTNEYAERFVAPAGITGLWQVSKRGKEDMSAEERILLDIQYARDHGLKTDMRIMIRTPAALIQKSNV